MDDGTGIFLGVVSGCMVGGVLAILILRSRWKAVIPTFTGGIGAMALIAIVLHSDIAQNEIEPVGETVEAMRSTAPTSIFVWRGPIEISCEGSDSLPSPQQHTGDLLSAIDPSASEASNPYQENQCPVE